MKEDLTSAIAAIYNPVTGNIKPKAANCLRFFTAKAVRFLSLIKTFSSLMDINAVPKRCRSFLYFSRNVPENRIFYENKAVFTENAEFSAIF